MLSGERLLIIEEEFLIALDIQRALEEANALQTVFARNFAEAASMQERFGEFDLAIVNAPLPGTPDIDIANRLASAGPAIVICTAAPVDLTDTQLSTAELVHKPFSDEALVSACRRALQRRAS